MAIGSLTKSSPLLVNFFSLFSTLHHTRVILCNDSSHKICDSKLALNYRKFSNDGSVIFKSISNHSLEKKSLINSVGEALLLLRLQVAKVNTLILFSTLKQTIEVIHSTDFICDIFSLSGALFLFLFFTKPTK